MNYDVIIIGAGPGGIYSAYELMRLRSDLRVAVFETGNPLHKRKCPIDGKKIKSCIHCKTCAIMNGFGGAAHFLTANTISPISLAARCTSILARSRPLN